MFMFLLAFGPDTLAVPVSDVGAIAPFRDVQDIFERRWAFWSTFWNFSVIGSGFNYGFDVRRDEGLSRLELGLFFINDPKVPIYGEFGHKEAFLYSGVFSPFVGAYIGGDIEGLVLLKLGVSYFWTEYVSGDDEGERAFYFMPTVSGGMIYRFKSLPVRGISKFRVGILFKDIGAPVVFGSVPSVMPWRAGLSVSGSFPLGERRSLDFALYPGYGRDGFWISSVVELMVFSSLISYFGAGYGVPDYIVFGLKIFRGAFYLDFSVGYGVGINGHAGAGLRF